MRGIVKNSLHLDLRAGDANKEARRLCGLGASIVAERENLISMQRSERNEFYILR